MAPAARERGEIGGGDREEDEGAAQMEEGAKDEREAIEAKRELNAVE